MVRILLSSLLAVNLLACPLRCFSCTAVESVDDRSSEVACFCCEQNCELPVSEAPADPSNQECTCQDCICEGATLQGDVKLPDASDVVALHFRLPSGHQIPGVLKEALLLHECSVILGGRGTRIAHQSLLI